MYNLLIKRRLEWILFAVLTILPPINYVAREYMGFFFVSKTLMLGLATVLIMLVVLRQRNRIGELIQADSINILLAVYLGLLVVSLFFTDNLMTAIAGKMYREEGLITIMMYFLLFLVARNIDDPDQKIYTGLLLAATLFAFFGIVQYLGIDFFREGTIARTRSESIFDNPNFYGSYLVLMLPLAIDKYIRKRSRWGLVVYAILLFTLFATMTRGSWIGAALALIFYALLWIRLSHRFKVDLKRYLWIALVSILVIVSFNVVSGGRFQERFQSIGGESMKVLAPEGVEQKDVPARAFIWKNVIQLVKERPLTGYGLENLGQVFTENVAEETREYVGYSVIIDRAHNEYLHIAVSSGVPSLLVYLLFIGRILWVAGSRIRRRLDLLPFFAAVIGYLIQASFNISVVTVAYVFWIFLGFLSSYKRVYKDRIARSNWF
ncbi:O-antigen ligase family protein [Clostridia bacterium]|nr:O-antigen ligase family protein [Clostridia bacterium]